MTDTTLEFTPVASRPPPRPETGLVHWLKKNLFDGWSNTLTTLLVLVGYAIPGFVLGVVLLVVFGGQLLFRCWLVL